MNDLSARSEESLSALLRMDAACQTFEDAWKAARNGGPRPRIEDCLAAAPEAERGPLLLKLLPVELHYRRAEPSTTDEYRQRFPEYTDLLGPVLERLLQPAYDTADPGVTGSPYDPYSTHPEPVRVESQKDSVTPDGDSLPCVPGYEVLEVLGRGGMGVVFMAWQVKVGRLVALKMILVGGQANPALLERFRMEPEFMVRLPHPNIIQIHDVGECGGLPFFAMEYMEGGSLARSLTGAPLSAARAASMIEVLARAVHYAHQRNVVHRDLKPANILMAGDGTLKIADFGLARFILGSPAMTYSGAILGTPAYMAPEQAAGNTRAIGPATDVYALGAILYQLLTGRPPFIAETPLDTMMQVRSDEPVPPRQLQPKAPRDLETICLKCLEKEPGRRYASADALAEDCAAFLRGGSIFARPVGPAERSWRWARRNPAVASLVTTLVLVLVTGLAGVVSLLVLAIERGKQAETNFEAAEDQIRLAAKENDRFRHILYAAHTQLIRQAWEDAHIAAGLKLLDGEGCRPIEPGQVDLRDWEWYYLRGLCHKDLRTLKADAKNLSYVVFSPDGKRLAAASVDKGELYLWDAGTGQLLHVLSGHRNAVWMVAFRPDGKQLASASADGTVKLWDTASGTETRSFPITEKHVHCVAFSPDGSQLASGDDAAVVTLWQTDGEKKTRTLRGHTGPVISVAFSADGHQLASAGRDRTAMFWDVASGQSTATLKGHTMQISSVAYSPDGATLATGSEDYTVKLWDVVSRKERLTLTGHTAWPYRVAFSPDGRQVASAGYDGLVKLWDAGTGREIRTLRGHTTNYVHGVSFGPDGRRLASCAFDGTVKVWDLTTRSQEFRTLDGHTLPITRVVFSPNGQRLASASRDRKLRLWDVASGREIHTLTGHKGEVWCVAFGPDGRQLASASDDATVMLWDADTGQAIRTFEGHGGIVRAVVFSPDGKLLALGNGDGTVGFWDVARGNEIRSLPGHTKAVLAVAFSPSGRQLASAGADGVVILWDVFRGAEIRTLAGNSKWCGSVAFSPDGRQLVSGHDGLIKCWDAATGQQIHEMTGHVDLVLGLAFSPGGRLASAGADQTVRLWDATSGHEILTLKASTSLVYTVAFSPDGRWLASAGSRLEIKLWNGPRDGTAGTLPTSFPAP